jgi:hypothetical protein
MDLAATVKPVHNRLYKNKKKNTNNIAEDAPSHHNPSPASTVIKPNPSHNSQKTIATKMATTMSVKPAPDTNHNKKSNNGNNTDNKTLHQHKKPAGSVTKHSQSPNI